MPSLSRTASTTRCCLWEAAEAGWRAAMDRRGGGEEGIWGKKRRGSGPDRGAEPWNQLNLFCLPPSTGDRRNCLPTPHPSLRLYWVWPAQNTGFPEDKAWSLLPGPDPA